MKVIYRSTYHTLFQSEKERCFYIDFGQKIVRASFCQLLALRQKVLSIQIEHHFDSDLNKHGLELLQFCNKEHLFILNTLEVLDLRELVAHGFALLGISAKSEALAI